jgi:hypothetical protein
MRDRFLVLAADALFAAGNKDEAERLRARLLAGNPHHLLRPYDSLAQALAAADVRNYIDGLKRHYPREKAGQLLEGLGKVEAAHTTKAPANAAHGTGPPAGAPAPVRGDSLPLRLQPQPDLKPPRAAALPISPAASSGAYQLLPDDRSTWRDTGLDADRAGQYPGSWAAAVLFWLVLLLGVAWAVYTLGRPFVAL